MSDAEAQKEAREALIEQATWALIDYDTDVADRGVSDEHYRERRADVERVFPILASRAPQPTEGDDYDSELAVMLSQMLDDEPMWSCVVIAKRLHAAGFRRAPAEPAVQEPTMTAEGIPFVAVGDRWLAVYTAEKQAEALEQAAAAGAGYVVTAANRRYREGAEHADIYWKLALERAAQRLREQATNQQNGGQ